MIKHIDETHRAKAIFLLQLLLVSRRPLKLSAAVDALATDVEAKTPFEMNNRMPQPRDIGRICPSLISMTYAEDIENEYEDESEEDDDEEYDEQYENEEENSEKDECSEDGDQDQHEDGNDKDKNNLNGQDGNESGSDNYEDEKKGENDIPQNEEEESNDPEIVLQFAHSSVKEYLQSKALSTDIAPSFSESAIATAVVRACLSYLFQISDYQVESDLDIANDELEQELPRAPHAAEHWPICAREADRSGDPVVQTLLWRFLTNQSVFDRWQQLYDYDEAAGTEILHWSGQRQEIPRTPLNCASRAGINSCVEN